MVNKEMLFQQIMHARSRVYQVCDPSPLECYRLDNGATLFLKREDLSPIHAYKWRGAYNMMAAQPKEVLAKGVVAASAGNHAQGIALAAAKLGCRARIFMPRSVPKMKAREVARHGGANVEIVITGDNYDESSQAAKKAAQESGALYVPAYDDILVMAGQGTIGDEIIMEAVKPDVAFLQIGGGGLAAGVACALKTYYPDIRIVGVEGENQASMAAAARNGHPVVLPNIDIFCDGTAVKKAGEVTFEYCRELIDEFMTVSNDDVCAAAQVLWETARSMPEPSGAMGVAGFLKRKDEFAGKKALAVLTGANMDFSRLSWISRRAGIGLSSTRYFEIKLPERAGAMLDLLVKIDDLDINIVDFIYGKVDDEGGFPVLGFAVNETSRAALEKRLTECGFAFQDVTNREDVAFRIVSCQPSLFKLPYIAIIEFPERPGALLEFMTQAARFSNICYFNYANSGEQVGRGLMGFEFENENDRGMFLEYLETSGPRHHPVSLDVLRYRQR